MRKVVIVLASLVVVGLTYWVYSQFSDSTSLEPPVSYSEHELKLPESTKDAQAFGQTVIHQAEQSRYVELDPETKAVKRVFGFSRLLNPGSQSLRWQVEKPYIVFYEPSFQCRIDADNGQFQIERAGANVSPRDGQLEGNVVIHIMPKPDSDLAETHLLLDDLLFSSERTEFSTDGPVQMTSSQVELLGRGLVLLFNAQDGQVEYLHVLDLESLRIKNFVEAQKNIKTSTPATKEEPVVANGTTVAKPATAAAAEPKVPADDPQTPDTVPLYQCIIDTNVKIHYGNQIVVAGADQVDIQNIAFLRRKESESSEKTETSSLDGAESTETTTPEALPTPSQERQSSPPAAIAQADAADDRQDVLVTCDGGIVFELVSEMKEADDIHVAGKATNLKAEAESALADSGQTAGAGIDRDTAWGTPFEANASTALAQGDAAGQQPPALFEARKIGYDLQTGSGRATGPVRFVFYQEADPNSTTATVYWPVEITANGDTEFVAGADRQIEKIVFNQNVNGVRTRQFEMYAQMEAFHSDTMEVMMGTGSTGQMEIQQITLRDGDVFAESIRKNAAEKLAHTRLSCQQILYTVTSERFVATGPGQIELDNSKAEPTMQSPGKGAVDLKGPCFAQIKGFDSIEWSSADQRIIADGKTNIVEVAFIPVVNGTPDKVIRAASGRVEMELADGADGQTQLSRLTARDYVYFEEPGQHILKGDTLVYPSVEGSDWLSITGTEESPCMVDGARVPYIHFNLTTRDLETRLSTIPGAVSVPPRK